MAKRKAFLLLATQVVASLNEQKDDVDSSDDDNSWDEEVAIIISSVFDRKKRLRIDTFMDTIHQFSNQEFKDNFRLDKNVVDQLISGYEASVFFPSHDLNGKSDISAQKAFMMFLWFAGNKTTLREVAGRFQVCPATVFRYNDTVMDYLVSIAPHVIKLPENNHEVAEDFNNIYGISGVIGIIDGTHIRIRTPKHKPRSMYCDRDKQITMGVQVICDIRRKFVDVSTGFPGKVHDSTMFSLSDISEELPARFGEQYHLIGDSAYALQQNLITPYNRNQANLPADKKKFNTRFSQMRVLVENSIAVLRSVFRGITNIDMHEVDKISKFIISVCVLHNLRIDKNFIIERDGDIEEWIPIIEVPEDISRRVGQQKRDAMKDRIING